MTCPGCRREILEEAQFCGFCGLSLDGGAAFDARDAPTGDIDPRFGVGPPEPGPGVPEVDDEDSSYVGQIVDRRYQVLSVIARGGMGTVYKVVHVHMRKLLAMKLLHEHILARRKLVARFMREARAISRLSNPHTVRVFDFGKHREVFYLVMEHLEGEDLYSLMAREGPLPAARTARILDQICQSLEEAHAAGIIHRDLKSENIMVLRRAPRDSRVTDPTMDEVDPDNADEQATEDFVKVLDFGMAKVMDADERITAQSQPDLFGTPYYMAPEQIRGRPIDGRCDIYALGALAFKMLTGTFPFAQGSPFETLRAHLNDPIPRMQLRAPGRDVPQWITRIVEKCLSKHPDGRYADVSALRAALLEGLQRHGAEPTQPVPEGFSAPLFEARVARPLARVRKAAFAPLTGAAEPSRAEVLAFERRTLMKKIMAAAFLGAVVLGVGFAAWTWLDAKDRPSGAESEPNTSQELANAVQAGWVVQGFMGRRTSRQESDVDWFKVQLPDANPRMMDFRLEGIPNMDLALEVRDADNRLLARVNREGVGAEEAIRHVAVSGTHLFARVSEAGRPPGTLPTENLSDPYRLWTRIATVPPRDGEEQEPNDVVERSQSLRLGQPVSGSIDTPNDVDRFQLLIEGRPPPVLSLAVSGTDGVPVRVRLEDGAGHVLFGHTFAPAVDEQVVHVARAWTYSPRLVAAVGTGKGLRATGRYRFRVSAAPSDLLKEREPNDNAVLAQPTVLHAVTRGRLEDGDVDVFAVPSSADDHETTEISVGVTGRKRPKVTARPRARAAGGGDGSVAVKLKRDRASDRRNPRWEGHILLAHPGQEVLVVLEAGAGAADYELRALRSPARGVSAVDLGR